MLILGNKLKTFILLHVNLDRSIYTPDSWLELLGCTSSGLCSLYLRRCNGAQRYDLCEVRGS